AGHRPGRAARAGHLAPGPLPALRRRHHLLGAGRDRQGPGRHPGVRPPGRGHGQAGGGRGRPGLRPGRRRVAQGPHRPPARAGRRRRGPGRALGGVRRLAPPGRGDGRRPPPGPGGRGPALGRPGDARVLRAPLRLRRGGRAGPGPPPVAIDPLTEAETAQLVAGLLGQSLLPPEIQALLLERAGGNPLYAEEFVRLLSDRGLLVRSGRVVRLATTATIPFPDTVQALIAARLAMLPAGGKALFRDAAVVARVFWPGALAALAGTAEPAMLE